MKQEWESQGIQNGTVLEAGSPGSPLLRPVNDAALPLRERLVSWVAGEKPAARRGTGPFHYVETLGRGGRENHAGHI